MDTNIHQTDHESAMEHEDSQDVHGQESVQQEQPADQVSKRKNIHKNALYAAGLWRNTTDRVDPHRKTGFIE